MTFRARLLLAFFAAVMLPLGGLAVVVHKQMTDHLRSQYERRVDALAALIANDLDRERDTISMALAQVRESIANDNRFRYATAGGNDADRRYLLDFAGDAMRLAGLSMLQIQDETGRILSSGHFRNDYDRVDPVLPGLVAAAPNHTALIQARTAGPPVLVLAGVDSTRVGPRTFTLVGGVDIRSRFVGRVSGDGALRVTLSVPGDSSAAGASTGAGDAIVRRLPVPFADPDAGTVATAWFDVSHGLEELRAVRGAVDNGFMIAVALSGLLGALLVGWAASRISRPLASLAKKAARVDLDRLDVDFATSRRDEIGTLASALGAMLARLREGAAQLRDAERRAAVGELARQVTHDIKNGLTPIRNVYRHLADESERDPVRLTDVFRERRDALDSSISYLEGLASNYARLSRRGSPRPLDANAVVRAVAAEHRDTANVRVDIDLGDAAVVSIDPLALRRILENLVDNAIDSFDGRPGRVTLRTRVVYRDDGRDAWARVEIIDDGPGIGDEERARIFDDFYTTKATGTGLGLSIVRRLVMDAGGSIRADSTPGKGSRFSVDIPIAAESAGGGES